MNPEKVWIVIVLLIVILGVSNLAMYGLVRGWMPRKGQKDVIQHLTDFSKPLKKENDRFKELNERVKALQNDPQDED